MAEETKTGKSLAQQSWIWMIVAIVATLGLMVWLGVQSEQHRAQVALMEEERATTEVEDEDDERYETVSLSAVSLSPEEYEGREVRVENVSVGADLGSGAFWAMVPDASPFLVVYGDEVQDPPPVTEASVFVIRGSVEALDPGSIDRWVETGRMHPDARQQLDFATHYLDAHRVRSADPEAGAEVGVDPEADADADDAPDADD
jgi:hypothetical protein